MSSDTQHLDADARSLAMRHAQTLVHDVAKYLSRVAQNVPEGEVPQPALRRLLLADVYALDGERPASEVYRELSSPLRALVADARLTEVERLLSRADTLEACARGDQHDALRELASICRRVAMTLRAVARDIAGERA